MKYYSYEKDPTFSSITVSICVTKTRLPNQYHSGFLFKDTKGTPMFLHLEWHEKLSYVPVPIDKNMVWLNMPLDSIEIELFIWMLENIAKENGSLLAYGISNDISFTEEGTLLKEHQFSGVTCASFILQVCNSCGFKIIDVDNWDIRAEDMVWQKFIIDYLQNVCSDEYIKHQQQYIGKVARYKPTEVAVAANSRNRPLKQNQIIELSNKLIKIIEERN